MGDSRDPANSRSISSTLLVRVRLHDEQAWQKLFSVWQPIVYHWCRAAGESPHDAEEIVQNVFLRVSQHIHTFERRSFRAWMWTITHHAIADHHRGHRDQPVVFGGGGSWINRIPAPERQSPSGSATSSSPAAQTGGEESDHQQERRFLVHQILEVIRSEVEECTFAAFWRTTIDGARAVDVARELGVTPTVVRSRKYRVLKRLREELETI